MDNPQYANLVKWAYQQSGYQYNSKVLEPTIRAFIENIDRLRAVSLMPAVMAAHASGRGNVPEGLGEGAALAEEYIKSIPVVRDGFKPLFSNVIIGAWTAFESLATDLWIAAVNLRPKSLGLKALKAQRKGQEAATENQQAKGKPHTLPVDLMAKYEFDLKDRLGYFLWRERYFDFNNLHQLRATYKAAFDEAEKWFSDPLHEDLAILEAMRHVLVHRGGRVDQFFIDRVTRHPVLSTLKLDDRVETLINGQITAASAELAMVCGLKLTDVVDNWLASSAE